MPRLNPRSQQTGGLMDRPSRVSIFARKQRRLLRPALGGGLLLCLVGGGAWFVHLAGDEARFAPLRAELGAGAAMHVAEIRVTGRDMTSQPALMRALGVSVGDDILGFSVEGARKRIDALPFVEHATVERRLPGTIVVRLVERRPYAVWQNQGRFVLIDRSGQVVADQGMNGKDAEAFAELPLVVGVGAPQAAASLIEALAAEPDVKSHVVAAVRVGGRRWNLTLRNGCDVLLPEGAEPQALHRLAILQHDHALLSRPLEAIDMRLPDRLVIRPRPTPVTEAADDGATPDGARPDAQPETGRQKTAAPAAAARKPAHEATQAATRQGTVSGGVHDDAGDGGADQDPGRGNTAATAPGAARAPDPDAGTDPDKGRRPA